MENLTNKLLTLDGGRKYLILRQAAYKGKTYFLAAELTDDGKDFTNKFDFLEKIDGDELTVQSVKDQEILNVLANNIKLESE